MNKANELFASFVDQQDLGAVIITVEEAFSVDLRWAGRWFAPEPALTHMEVGAEGEQDCSMIWTAQIRPERARITDLQQFVRSGGRPTHY